MKILIVFGTRPEAIKMVPIVKCFQNRGEEFKTRVCITAQHRHMLDQVLEFFGITPDYDLDLMKKDQNLYNLTADIITGMKPVLEDFSPDYVFVHGDTTTSSATALAAFYSGAKVCHVEAGLRTFNKYAPFPEEVNRQITGRIADIHFAPTITAKRNLLKENINESSIEVTGNTVIDTLQMTIQRLQTFRDDEINYLDSIVDSSKKLVLVTGHRRENFGAGFIDICKAILQLSGNEDVQIIYPVHLNPNVQGPVKNYLSNKNNIHLIEPLGYPAFVWLMSKAYLILTDSGGVQEEAPSLGKPVLVMRDTSERPEAIEAGTVILVGTDQQAIVEEANKLLHDESHYQRMASRHNPYGDGKASERVLEFLSR
jgi:UDP-N-acetylglucosamine 2-epimerase (non-hydrolysing)